MLARPTELLRDNDISAVTNLTCAMIIHICVYSGCWNGAAAHVEGTCCCLQGHQANARYALIGHTAALLLQQCWPHSLLLTLQVPSCIDHTASLHLFSIPGCSLVAVGMQKLLSSDFLFSYFCDLQHATGGLSEPVLFRSLPKHRHGVPCSIHNWAFKRCCASARLDHCVYAQHLYSRLLLV